MSSLVGELLVAVARAETAGVPEPPYLLVVSHPWLAQLRQELASSPFEPLSLDFVPVDPLKVWALDLNTAGSIMGIPLMLDGEVVNFRLEHYEQYDSDSNSERDD